MTYFIQPSTIYLINVLQGARYAIFFLLVILVFCVFATGFDLHDVVMSGNRNDKEKDADNSPGNIKRSLKIYTILMLIGVALLVLIPDKKTCLEIMTAKTVTVENVSVSMEDTKKAVDYIYSKINEK